MRHLSEAEVEELRAELDRELRNQGLTRNLREREQIKLGRIREALERLDEGSYGVCVECGGGIPFPRLLVFPEAPTCAACGGGG